MIDSLFTFCFDTKAKKIGIADVKFDPFYA